jgi:hypothetical protein
MWEKILQRYKKRSEGSKIHDITREWWGRDGRVVCCDINEKLVTMGHDSTRTPH